MARDCKFLDFCNKIATNTILVEHRSMRLFSTEQLVDASGQIQEASSVPGLVFDTEQNVAKQFPSFDDLKAQHLLAEGLNYPDAIVQKQSIPLPKRAVGLRKYDGATVVVGAKNRGSVVFLPGKVLPDGKLGVLATPSAARTKVRIGEPLNELEDLMLRKFYLEHSSDVAHEEGAANIAKIGLGVVIAAAKSMDGLHGVVHGFESQSASLPSQILANNITGNLSIPTNHGEYALDFRVVDPSHVAGIQAYEIHQLPGSVISGSDFDVTAGITKAIRDIQGQPTRLEENAAALLEPVTT